MRMNLNQQSSGDQWIIHKNLMNSTSPLVDCGVHYVDIMCQMTKSKPVYVNAVGARLTEKLMKKCTITGTYKLYLKMAQLDGMSLVGDQ